MHAFETTSLMTDSERPGERYREFLRVAALSCGLYRLRKGETDTQSPHGEDEVYYVLRGHARIRVGSEEREAKAGSIVYVPARTEHRFYGIVEDLALLVFFAPPEGSDRGGGRS